MKTEIIVKKYRYHNCNDCPLFIGPNSENKIVLKGDHGKPHIIQLSDFVLKPNGEQIPNPTIGACGVLGHTIKDTEYPIRKTDSGEAESAYHTYSGKCIIKHTITTKETEIN